MPSVHLPAGYRQAARAVDTYPGKIISSAGEASPAELGEHHRRSVGEIAPQHGGIAPIGEEDFHRHLRDDWRRFVEFQVSRGVLVPR